MDEAYSHLFCVDFLRGIAVTIINHPTFNQIYKKIVLVSYANASVLSYLGKTHMTTLEIKNESKSSILNVLLT